MKPTLQGARPAQAVCPPQVRMKPIARRQATPQSTGACHRLECLVHDRPRRQSMRGAHGCPPHPRRSIHTSTNQHGMQEQQSLQGRLKNPKARVLRLEQCTTKPTPKLHGCRPPHRHMPSQAGCFPASQQELCLLRSSASPPLGGGLPGLPGPPAPDFAARSSPPLPPASLKVSLS